MDIEKTIESYEIGIVKLNKKCKAIGIDDIYSHCLELILELTDNVIRSSSDECIKAEITEVKTDIDLGYMEYTIKISIVGVIGASIEMYVSTFKAGKDSIARLITDDNKFRVSAYIIVNGRDTKDEFCSILDKCTYKYSEVLVYINKVIRLVIAAKYKMTKSIDDSYIADNELTDKVDKIVAILKKR